MALKVGDFVVAARSVKVKGRVTELFDDKTHGPMCRVECLDGTKRAFRIDDVIPEVNDAA